MISKTEFEAKEPPIHEFSNPTSITDQMQLFKDSPVLSISIATTGEDPLKNKITSIAIGAPDRSPFMIDMTQSRSEELDTFLKQLLESPSEKVFYDAKKALNFFHVAGIEINGPIYDLMLADKILQSGQGGKKRIFDDIVSEYLGTAVSIDSTLSPIANVAAFLLKLRDVTIPMLQENSLMDTATLEFECIRAVAGMERNGIRVNNNKLMEMLQELTQRKDFFTKDLHEKIGIINLNSRKEVLEALHKQGIMVADTMQETLHEFMMPHVWLLNYFGYKKVAYDRSMAKGLLNRINTNTGRLHPQYSQIGAPTGRFSCSNPNLHAIPREEKFRSCFIAADDHKLIIADYSQIELRIVAEISRDERMIYAYKMGEDLHRLTGALVTGESIVDVSKGKKSFAEVVNLGLIYGMEARKLMEYSLNNQGVTMTLEQAEKFRSRFFSAYQGIAQWHEDVELRSGYETRTLGNRRRLLRWSYYTNNEDLLKAPIQGTAADILKKVLCILHGRIKGSGMKVIGCIHSEIITEAPIAETDRAAEILKESMIDAGKMYLKTVPVVVDVSIVDNWSEK